MSREYFVYIMASFSGSVLYTGFTSNLHKRVYEHRNRLGNGFAAKYNAVNLVYYDVGEDYDSVLAREKEIKGWKRDKKIALINTMNPEWIDLYDQICE